MMSATRWPLDFDASDQGERVRFCVGCGEVMAYALTRCPKCGHLNPPAPGMERGPRAPCPACGALRVASLLFCPECGASIGDEAAFAVGPGPAPARPAATGVSLLAVVLALLAPTLVLMALVHVLTRAAPGSSA